jgi:FkbM family methyltransferase
MSTIEESVIAKWKMTATKFRDLSRLHAQEFVDPYVVLKQEEFGPIRILIANIEGAASYDRVEITDCTFCRALGIVRQGDTVFDCSANQGITSLGFSNIVGPRGQVYAFDPFPINNELISLNAELNGRRNILVVTKGLSCSRREMNVSMSEQCTAGRAEAVGDEIEVRLVPLNEFAEARPHFLKIDVEGAEIDCLIGAHDVLAQNPAICIEMHPELVPKFGRRAEEVYDHIDVAQYTCYVRHLGEIEVRKMPSPGRIDSRCWLFFVPKERPPIARISPLGVHCE